MKVEAEILAIQPRHARNQQELEEAGRSLQQENRPC